MMFTFDPATPNFGLWPADKLLEAAELLDWFLWSGCILAAARRSGEAGVGREAEGAIQ